MPKKIFVGLIIMNIHGFITMFCNNNCQRINKERIKLDFRSETTCPLKYFTGDLLVNWIIHTTC